MERPSHSLWPLWLLALFGAYLYFGHQPPVGGHPAPAWPAGALVPWGALALAMRLVGVALAAAVVGLPAWAALRWTMRRRRMAAMEVDEIVLGPDDTATPFEVMSALDAIHGQLLTRYAAGAIGQVSWTFEIVRDAAGAVHFLLGAPHGWLPAIEDLWRAKYTNLRFQPWVDQPRPWPVAQQIVLAKPWRHATETVKDYQNSVVETIVQALDRAEGAAHLQFLLTPIPTGPLHARLRAQIRGMERQARAAQLADPAQPGVGYADSQVVKDALQLYGKAAFRTEIRLAADTWQTMQRVFGALAEANGENRFRATTVWLGKGLWTRWLYARVPSVGLFRPSILFSFPLATLIHLPSARLRVNSLRRQLVRRGPAPPGVARDPALALARDESGPVGIWEADRKFNLLLIGSHGSGKSTDLLNVVKVDSRWRDAHGRGKAVALLDIGKDTAKRALGIVPRDRTVLWVDPADPACPWALNPLGAAVPADALANDVLEDLTQVFGEEAIRANSRQFLGNAILAVREVLGAQGDFTAMYRMLTDEAFLARIAQSVRDPHQQAYWQGEFARLVAANPRFLEERLAAPRNKLDEVLRNPAVRAFLNATPGRIPLDLQRVIRERQILLVNLDKAKLGKAGARLIGVILITMLWHALEAQTDLPEAERVPVSLILDEAQNFISEGFLDILAEGRAYGAQTTVAVRFLQEIASEKVILGLQALAQNLMVHQFELLDEAEIFMKRFMRVFANMITTADESQDALNFGADDFMRLPKFHAVCRYMVHGQPAPAFLATTIPWEDAYDEATRAYHLAAQPKPEPVPETRADTAAEPMAAASTPAGGEPAATAPGASARRRLRRLRPARRGTAAVPAASPPPGPDPLPPAEAGAAPAPPPAPEAPAERPGQAVLEAFARRYHRAPRLLRETARQCGATDMDLVAAVRWVLAHDIPEAQALGRLETLLRLKVEDRLLQPLCRQVGADREAVRDAFLAAGRPVTDAEAIRAAHPEVDSLEALRAVLGAVPVRG